MVGTAGNATQFVRYTINAVWEPTQMTPQDDDRINELAKLIAEEKDPDKVEILSAELERLLRLKLERSKEKRGK
jgi:hypothetical protein